MKLNYVWLPLMTIAQSRIISQWTVDMTALYDKLLICRNHSKFDEYEMRCLRCRVHWVSVDACKKWFKQIFLTATETHKFWTQRATIHITATWICVCIYIINWSSCQVISNISVYKFIRRAHKFWNARQTYALLWRTLDIKKVFSFDVRLEYILTIWV